MRRERNFLKSTVNGMNRVVFSPVTLAGASTYRLQALPWLVQNLAGGVGALFIRFLLYRIAVDEKQNTRWRLENKYIQYLIFNHFIPAYIPHTLSLGKLLNRKNGEHKVKALIQAGYFLKQTLGDGSYARHSFDKTEELANLLNSPAPYRCEEKWILQKRLSIVKEYRIHTFGKDLIAGLTFSFHGEDTLNDRLAAEYFIIDILIRLPGYITDKALIGWDLALSKEGRWYLIEANFTGLHPVHKPGFQTTGYVEYNDIGPITCAWINLFFLKRYNLSIQNIEKQLLNDFQFYRDCIFYMSLFTLKHYNSFSQKKIENNVSAIIYLGQEYYNQVATLITYLQRVYFASNYHVIYHEKNEEDVMNLFSNNNKVILVPESMVLTKFEFEVVVVMNGKRRKSYVCKSYIRQTGLDFTIII